MQRDAGWTTSKVEAGIGSWDLKSWKYFDDFIAREMLDFTNYIWRGQRNEDWPLESSLDRHLKGIEPRLRGSVATKHLEAFKYAARGRRGINPPSLPQSNDWWALGQHHGLATPLLDWTTSPFAAAYFAFIGAGANQTPGRALYALDRETVEEKSAELKQAHGEKKSRPPIVEFVRPMSDDNPRLVSQGGLFTRAPTAVTIEEWVRKHFPTVTDNYILIKVTIPDSDRIDCLRCLNRMNINHLTLFPDLFGASKFCNLALEIENY